MSKQGEVMETIYQTVRKYNEVNREGIEPARLVKLLSASLSVNPELVKECARTLVDGGRCYLRYSDGKCEMFARVGVMVS